MTFKRIDSVRIYPYNYEKEVEERLRKLIDNITEDQESWCYAELYHNLLWWHYNEIKLWKERKKSHGK